MEVILAIWVPKDRIAWTLLLTLGVLYIYAALSFTQFRDDYSNNIPNSCDSVYTEYYLNVAQDTHFILNLK